MVNEILKSSKKPMGSVEATAIQNKICIQKYAEQEAKNFHEQAQRLRIEIQEAMGFSCDEYYSFLQKIK